MRYMITPKRGSLGGSQLFSLRIDCGPTLVFNSADPEPKEAEIEETTVVQLRNDGYTVELVTAAPAWPELEEAEETD